MDGVRQAVSGEGGERRRRNAAEPEGGITEVAMPRLTFAQIAEMVHGTVLQGDAIEASSVVIDSREARPDSVFFAIRGERLDGHQFLPQALRTARGAVVSQVPGDLPADRGIVQ